MAESSLDARDTSLVSCSSPGRRFFFFTELDFIAGEGWKWAKTLLHIFNISSFFLLRYVASGAQSRNRDSRQSRNCEKYGGEPPLVRRNANSFRINSSAHFQGLVTRDKLFCAAQQLGSFAFCVKDFRFTEDSRQLFQSDKERIAEVALLSRIKEDPGSHFLAAPPKHRVSRGRKCHQQSFLHRESSCRHRFMFGGRNESKSSYGRSRSPRSWLYPSIVRKRFREETRSNRTGQRRRCGKRPQGFGYGGEEGSGKERRPTPWRRSPTTAIPRNATRAPPAKRDVEDRLPQGL